MMDLKQAQHYCEKKAVRSGSSFYYSFLFLAPDLRHTMTALYAFCREVDDIVDMDKDPSVARQTLNWWREEIVRLYQHQASHPITKVLQSTDLTQRAPQSYFQDIIDGMEMDLDIHHYPSFRELELYCYRVAGAVGILTTYVFGFTQEATLTFAKKLGIALQLINIIRDVGEDARCARIYIPGNELVQYGVEAQMLTQRTNNKATHDLLQHQAGRARRIYQEALQILPKEDRSQQRVSLIMGEIYLQLLNEIEHDGFIIRNECITLTPIRKLYLAWRTYRREKKAA